MVLALIEYAYQSVKDTKPVWYTAYAAIFLVLARIWSSTPSLRVKRVLHGKNVVISGGLTPLNLSLARSLASQGAQIVLLQKDPTSPAVQQLVHLIQYASGNERVYAEACDTSGSSADSLKSISEFCIKWKKNRRKSPLGEELGYEPIDTLILSDDDCTLQHGFGTLNKREVYHGACLRNKVALIDGLSPVLRDAKTRIINVVSPFYAASPPLQVALDDDPASPGEAAEIWTTPYWHPNQPWTFAAPHALASIALFTHLSHEPYKFTTFSISPGMSRAWFFQALTAETGALGWILAAALSPLLWAFGKSMAECTTAVERGVHVDLQDKKTQARGIREGSLIVNGRGVLTELTDDSVGESILRTEKHMVERAIKS